MPNPLTLTGIGKAMVGGAFSAAGGAAIRAGTNPLKEGASQAVWYKVPIIYPDAATMIMAHRMGIAGPSLVEDVCKYNGVDFSPIWPPEDLGYHNLAWHAASLVPLARPSPDIWMGMLYAELMGEEEAKKRVKRTGADWSDWSAAYETRAMHGVPDMSTLVTAITRQLIEPNDYLRIAGRQLENVDEWSKVFPVFWNTPDVRMLADLRNRGVIDDASYDSMLIRLGWGRASDRNGLEVLRHRLPSAGEIIQFCTRGAFDTVVSAGLGLYGGQPDQYQKLMANIGLDTPSGFQAFKDGVIQPVNVADLLWASTRRVISVGEAQAAYHRLRPDAITDVQKFVPDAEVFTREMLQMVLAAHGEPKQQFATIEELGFIPLSLREIRMSVKLGAKSKEWVVARLQDQGHRKDRAEDLYDIIWAQELWRRNNGIRSLVENGPAVAAREVLASYEEGTIDAEGATTNLAQLGLKNEPIALQLAIVDSRVIRKIVRAGVTSVKRDYINGTLNAEEAAVQLVAMGVAQKRVGQYLAVWTLQRSRTRRTASTAQLLSYVQEGLEDEATAEMRLQNLGWDKPDIVLMMARVKGKMAQIKAKQAQAAEKAALAKAKALAQAQKQAQDLVKRLQADNRRATPRATLDKWLCDGIISEGYYLYRMTVMGFPASQAKRYLDDAKRKKVCQPADESETQGEEAADAGLTPPDGGQQP